MFFLRSLSLAASSIFTLAITIGLLAQINQVGAAGGNGTSIVNGGAGGLGGINGSLTEATGKDGGDADMATRAGTGGGGATDTSTGNGAAGGSRGVAGTMYMGAKGATGSVGSVIDIVTQISTSIHGGDGGAGEASVTNVNSTGGGGGGGAGLQSSAAMIILQSGSIFGGNGTAGSLVSGGGGGVGIFSSADVSIDAGGIVIGGNGGGSTFSSAGGQGAAGIMSSAKSTIENRGTIRGGAGGRGGLNSGGGDGASAIEMLAGGKIFNSETGIIQGGDGGIGRTNLFAATPLKPGTGGAGINGANLTIINAGLINVGTGGTATGWTPVSEAAVHFTGGENTLELWSTSAISGSVLADGENDRLILGGTTDGQFDVGLLGVGQQYTGFEVFEKTGTSVWSMNNSTDEATNWIISQGTLAISSDSSLGDLTGVVTLNGGRLQTTADITSGRNITLTDSGGTIETAADTEFVSTGALSGAGSLAKTGEGKLTLSGQNTYTGETKISGGALSLSGNGDISQSSRVNVSGVFDISESNDVSIRSLTGDGLVEVGVNSLAISHANDTFSGTLSGAGAFKLLSGAQTLEGNSATYTGGINIIGGTLIVDGAVGGNMNVIGGFLSGSGSVGTTTNYSGGTIAPGTSIGALTINGDYHSEGGALAIEAELGIDNSPADQLIITGNAYLGTAKTTVYVMNLNGLGAPTTEGIKIITVGGQSDNAFSLEGNFTTQDGAQAVVAGAYAYRLQQGNGATTNANDWYLRSALKETSTSPEVPGVDPNLPGEEPSNPGGTPNVPGVDPTFPEEEPSNPGGTPNVPGVDPTLPEERPGSPGGTPNVPGVDPNTPEFEPSMPEYQPGVTIYEAYPRVLQDLNQPSTLQQRKSNRVWFSNGDRLISQDAGKINSPYATPESRNMTVDANGVWARMEGAHNHTTPHSSTTGANYRQNYIKLQTGIEGLLTETASGSLSGGIMLQYVHGKADVKSHNYADGDISTDGYGLGGTLTWYGNNGFYIDGQAQTTWYKSDLSTQATDAPSLENGNNAFGYTLSIEAGQQIEMTSGWSVTPQTQLVYSNIAFDDFVDGFGSDVSLNKGDRLLSRFGVSLNNGASWQNKLGMINRANLYGIFNIYYDFIEDSSVDVSGIPISSARQSFWGGIGIGASHNWNDDKYSLYGEGSINSGLRSIGENYNISGTIGLRIKW